MVRRFSSCVLRAALSLAACGTAHSLFAQSVYERYPFSTFAGNAAVAGSADGTARNAQFNNPGSVAVDAAGNVFVADTNNHTIRKVTPAGAVTTFAGAAGVHGSADGTAGAARFYYPQGIAIDGVGNLYVADTSNHTIRKITASGVVSTLAGTAGSVGTADGNASAARFSFPQGVAVDHGGNVYVADTGNHTIRKITAAAVVTTLAGSPNQVGISDGSGSSAQFFEPGGVAVDSTGNVFVADSSNDTIRRITPDGLVTTFAGLAGKAGPDDGNGSAARFFYPRGVAVDSNGVLYVADTYNDTIRRISPSADVTTVAGAYSQPASGEDGVGAAARFSGPYGVAIDGAGNV
ncbi:MAG: NHL repeat-containing protein, partial [Chthoniobacterales bacterium]